MEKTYKPVPDCEALRYKGTKDKPDIKIFVSHRIDLDAQTIDNPLYIPVRCGAAKGEWSDVSLLGDDTGDSISGQVDTFGTLTVMYWMWKNVSADYYGLCDSKHYISCVEQQENNDDSDDALEKNKTKKESKAYQPISVDKKEQGFVFSTDIKQACDVYQIDSMDALSELCENSFAVGCKPIDLQSGGYCSIHDYWSKHPVTSDTTLTGMLLAEIEEKYPQMYEVAKKYFYNHAKMYPGNVMLLDAKHFDECSGFVFDILFELQRRYDNRHCSKCRRNILERVGTQLIGTYLEYIAQNEERIEYRQGIYIDEVLPKKPLMPAFSEKNNVIVFSCSDWFSPYLGITLKSTVESSSSEQNYDIIVLEKTISKENQQRVLNLVKEHKNFSVRFVDVSNMVRNATFYLPANNADLSEETYYTILVPWVLENYDKALVLDCDLLIARDLSELYNIDVTEYYLAAAKEYLFQCFLNSPIINPAKTVSKYCRNKLGLENEYDYYQAGVLLMNLDRFRKNFTVEELLIDVAESNYNIVEQDLFNKICKGKILELGYEWNYMACYSEETIPLMDYAPYEEQTKYEAVAKDGIIGIYHYITKYKPWKFPELKYADLWWNCARGSEYYETLMYRMSTGISGGVSAVTPEVYQLLQMHGLAPIPQTGIRNVADVLMPYGSTRRRLAKALFPKDSPQWNFFKKIFRFFKPVKN